MNKYIIAQYGGKIKIPWWRLWFERWKLGTFISQTEGGIMWNLFIQLGKERHILYQSLGGDIQELSHQMLLLGHFMASDRPVFYVLKERL